MQNTQARQTAYKVWISELTNSIYKTQEGFKPNYILTQTNKKISRVNIIATVISKYINEDETYATLTLDDNSSKIIIKAFKDDLYMIKPIEISDIILVIGKPKQSNNQLFILPETIKKVNLFWLKLRRLELLKTTPTKIEESQIIDKGITDIPNIVRQKILNSIEQLDLKDGAPINEVIQKSNLNANKAKYIIQELIKDGEIFEIKGKLKLMG